jgi:hypothetical protein
MFDWGSLTFATLVASLATFLFLWLLQVTIKTLFINYTNNLVDERNYTCLRCVDIEMIKTDIRLLKTEVIVIQEIIDRGSI